MTKEEIEKEIAEIKADREYNINAIFSDGERLKRQVDEFTQNAVALADSYAYSMIEQLNKLLEATNESDNH